MLAMLAAALALPAGALGSTAHASGHHRRGRHAQTAPRGSRRARSGRHRGRHADAARRHAMLRGHAADGGPCVDQDIAPNGEDLAQVRRSTLCLINRERVRHGERPLLENSRLQRAAQEHTRSMISADYFGHDGPGGQTPAQRMRAAGYIPGGNVGYEVGENLAWGTLRLASPQAIVAAWMRSPEHRANILDARFRETAIGVLAQVPYSVAGSQPGAIYTQDFGVIVAP